MIRYWSVLVAFIVAGCGSGSTERDGGTVGGTGGGSPSRTYALGSSPIFSAWSGGSSSGAPDPMYVTRGDCTPSFLATGLNFAPGKYLPPSTNARLSLVCNQLLPTQIGMSSSNSTILGYGTEFMTTSVCPPGSIMVGIGHGNGPSMYYLHAAAPICSTLEEWSAQTPAAQTHDGQLIGEPPLAARAVCPQGMALVGVEAILGFSNYQLAPPVRAICSAIVMQ